MFEIAFVNASGTIEVGVGLGLSGMSAVFDNEKEEDDYNFVPHIYNKATKKLIKYLFKNYKGTSEQKFSNLLEFPPDKKPITKGDFIDLFLDKTSKEYAEIWFNAEFPKPDNIVIIDNLLAAIKKNRYKVIYIMK